MADHAWCHDVARDEAVRAAEDGRDRPLTTLEQCIEWMFPKSVSPSSATDHENKGDGMRTERVTLDVVQGDRESVCVVIGTETDRDFARREKDAAIFHITELRTERDKLQARVAELEAASGGGEQSRGWLTGEERLALDAARTIIDGSGRTNIGVAIDDILARSSPPEVVLPVADCSWCSDYATVWRECLEAVRSSLAAAGVEVKEVGNE